MILKKHIKFFLVCLIVVWSSINLFERTFHHSFEKFTLSTLQRINYQPALFPNQITIIDTSPIYNLSTQRTERLALVDLLQAVKLGQPQVVGLDIMLERDINDPADSLLKAVLTGWHEIVVPHRVDPFFEVFDKNRLANIQIHDGYEIPVSNQGFLSLPFQMAKQCGLKIPAEDELMVVNYGIAYADLAGTGQLLSALDLLNLFNDAALSPEQKRDELAMMLGSQIVLVGFCTDALNLDQHEMPLGRQPGILIWANTLNNIMNPSLRIHYNPAWLVLLGAFLISLVALFLKKIYEEYNFYYWIVYLLASLGQILLWSFLGIWLYFSWQIYMPIFSFSLAAMLAFPLMLQILNLLRVGKLLWYLPRTRHLPDPLKYGYLEYRRERNPFKQLHLVFTLVEECVRFAALLGLAQARSLDISLRGLFKMDFSRLTFGQWQEIMRTLAKKLQDHNQVLDAWKQIYFDRHSTGRWVENQLLKSLDGDKNKNILDNLDAERNEREFWLRNLQNKSSARRSIISGLNLMALKIFQRITRFFSPEISIEMTKRLQKRFGQVKHLIQLRNRIIHSSGAFMENEIYEEITPEFDRWLERFLFEKLKFWRDVIIEAESGENHHLVLKLKEAHFQLFPFFIREVCPVHFEEELFLLTESNDSQKSLLYQGREPNCKLLLKNKTEIHALLQEFLNESQKHPDETSR